MKAGRYRCTENWREERIYNILIEAKETDKSFILTLIEDTSRYPDGHMTVLFGDKGKAVISKKGSPHAIVNHDDWFVVYPNRNGVPFLFELEASGEVASS